METNNPCNITDKERLKMILDNDHCPDSLVDILYKFLWRYYDDISIMQVSKIMTLMNNCLEEKSKSFQELQFVARERATYLEAYLSGKMWKTEEAAKAAVDPQIKNAQAILDACRRCK